jgi:hypothetical protein
VVVGQIPAHPGPHGAAGPRAVIYRPNRLRGEHLPRYVESPPVAGVLHRICVTYAAVGVAVRLLGIATAVAVGSLTQLWVMASMR